jgi:non-ribosomal peptide synthase protein (TIGR01720 family)
MQDHEELDLNNSSDIALVGMAGRFPGAKNVNQFWQNLRDGVESVSWFTDQELEAAGIDPVALTHHNYVKARPVLEGVELFDAPFFGFSPREAEIMDPQHRLFLECAWEALENAGCDPESYPGLIGVYGGAGLNTYLLANLYPNRDLANRALDFQTISVSDKDFLTTNVSYKLNLKGPSITVQTFCSTSLVAVHLACQSLLNSECDLALAGGVTVQVPQNVGYTYQEGGILSPDGHCRSFDAQAQGTIFGSSVGIVVLKRLADALDSGDSIYAVIKGSAINNDGSLKGGFTAPSVHGQAEVVIETLAIAGVEPDTISYVEAHGTATPLGDPIEVAALTKAFRTGTRKQGFCAIGSVKSNVGHLDRAAGVVGLIKTTLALKHKQIPPSLHFENPNPKIDFANSPFYVNTKLTEWQANGTPRRAAVNSLGFGGTNAHVILEEAPVVAASSSSRPRQLLLLSSKTSSALEAATTNLAEHFKEHPELNLADAAYTLQVGRKAFNYRRMVVCRDLEDAVTMLDTRDQERVFSAHQVHREYPVAFMFPGQGAQHLRMAAELYQHEPTFRQQVDICSQMLRSQLGIDLRAVLFPAADQEATQQLQETWLTQPVLFVIEYALARLWMSWGIQPQAMIGHSIGEYVAACLAGVFTLEDALALVATRGKLMQALPQGAMLVVPLAESAIRTYLGDRLSLAAVNSPALCTVSGPADAIAELEQQLSAEGVACRSLHTSHAFHSSMVEPILEPFKAQLRRITLKPPQIPYLSNLTGTWITAAEATDPGYWAKHLRQTVRFNEGVEQLLTDAKYVLLEVGPGESLTTLVKRYPALAENQMVFASLPHPKKQQSDQAFLLNTLGHLWLAGVEIDWQGFYKHERRQKLPLPSYPFERQRYWVEAPNQETERKQVQPSLSKKPDIADWFYIPSWKRSMSPAPFAPEQLGASSACWLLFTDTYGVSSQIADRLSQAGQDVITVIEGKTFSQTGERTFTLNPGSSDDYNALLRQLRQLNKHPQTIVHALNINLPQRVELDAASQDRGFYSLLFLAQALGKQHTNAPLHLLVLSNNMQAVNDEDVLCPAKATILGPCHVIGQEYQHITCRSVDMILPQQYSWQAERLIDQLMAELIAPSAEPQVAYRGQHRWVPAYETIRLPGSVEPQPRLRTHGVYLITGGLGGIGLTLAEHLARTRQAKLILISRSTLPPRTSWTALLAANELSADLAHKVRQVQMLEELGAEVLVLGVDVADQAQMQAAIQQAYTRFGVIHGVIHAAGVAGGGMMQAKTPEGADKVLSAKLQGTQILGDLFSTAQLDFFILCSSLASLLGEFGQVDYCAANAFLDAFAHDYAARHNIFTVAINWDAWQDVGMAVKALLPSAHTTLPPTVHAQALTYPLLDQSILETPEQAIYLTELSVAHNWVLDDHRIQWQPVLPGTTYLEIIRAAFERQFQGGNIEIHDVLFMNPLLVREDTVKQLQLVLKQDGDMFAFRFTSQLDADTVQEHVIGRITQRDPEPPRTYSIDAILARCQIQERKKQNYLDSSPMNFGPRWQGLRQVYAGVNEGLALIELPEAFLADLEELHLHPALLDIATSFGSLYIDDGFYLPLAYKRVKIKQRLPRRFYSYVRYAPDTYVKRETFTFDIVLIDEAGLELVEIEKFTMKRVHPSAANLTDSAHHTSYTHADDPRQQSADGRVSSSTQIFQQRIQRGITPQEGVEVFDRILATAGLPQIIVSTKDLQATIEQVKTFTQSRLAEEGSKPQVARPRHARPSLQTPYAAPTNELEHALAVLWQELLGIDQVGINDNFFELGGDSVLGLQLIARARQTGLAFTPQQLFEYQTIAELQHVVDTTQFAHAAQATSTNTFSLTPFQHWQSELPFAAPAPWNQAVLLEIQHALDAAILEQALRHVVLRHDALRIGLPHMQPIASATCDDPILTIVDLTALPDEEQERALHTIIAKAQTTANGTAGPLLHGSLILRGSHRANYVLLTIHHLAVDHSSWDIILQDLDLICRQLDGDATFELPPVTVPFGHWLKHLQDYAESPALSQELNYWLTELQTPFDTLLIDKPDGSNTVESARTVTIRLNTDETYALLHTIPQLQRTQAREVLLTALVWTAAWWTGQRGILVDLEDDGREAFASNQAYSRTVGQFSLVFPILLQLEHAHSLADALQLIKERRRRVPSNGVGYGALRYLDHETAIVEQLQRLPQPQVSFRYQEQAAALLPRTELFSSVQALLEPPADAQRPRRYLLEITAHVSEHQMCLDWTYSEHVYHRATIERLAEHFQATLQSLINLCQSSETVGYTPSDFPDADLNQAALDMLLNKLGRAPEGAL